MPKQKRNKTKYPGIYFIDGISNLEGKSEKIFYLLYRKDGKLIEEKAGRQYQDCMTAAKAAKLRSLKMAGQKLSNREKRELELKLKMEKEDRWTIGRLWEEYKEVKSELKSIRTDNYVFQKHLAPHFKDKMASELSPLDIDRIRINLSKTKATQTVRYVLQLLKRTINYGVRRQYCSPLPFVIEMPKVNNQRTEDLSPEQLKSLLKAIEVDDNIQAANIMKMALFTGMRRGELFRLRWEDIHFEREFIHIRDPKGGIDQKIPLNGAPRQLLESHPREQNSAYVFPGRGGGQRTDIKKQVNRIKDRAGLPKKFRALHGLRHVYASILASSGQVDMYTLQKLLTHKSPQMTQRYAHLRDEALKRASKVAGDYFDQILNGKAALYVSRPTTK